MVKKKSRSWTKYQVKVDRRIVYLGVTKDLHRREMKHKQRWPKARITKIGRVTTKTGALKWEREHKFTRT